MSGRVTVVHLRRPKSHDLNDSRRDPFWKFGSFGLTGCHNKNILHPKNAAILDGSKLAFVQSGKGVMKLVYLSPPIRTVSYLNLLEARWLPSAPFKFEAAPFIVDQLGNTMFPKLQETFSMVNRDS